MPSSGRFQSRVFSELSRQRLKWGDRLQRWVRHSRIAASWSAQVLLYPIYVGFQAVRMASRQLGQARHGAQPRLKALMSAFRRATGRPTTPVIPPSTSTPIYKVLAAVEGLGLEVVKPAPDPALLLTPARAGAIAPQGTALPVTTSATVQGIASLLATRALVLISTENAVLDVLTKSQQALLRQRLVAELADYWRDRRQLAWAEDFQVLPLPPPPVSARLLPPIRGFYQLMAWEQRSDVAIAANLFQEAVLAMYFGHDPEEALAVLPDERMQASTSQALVRSPVSLPVVAAAPGQLQHSLEADSATALVVPQSDPQTAVIPFEPPSTAVSTQIDSQALQPYIETQAQLVAYEQHPLERLLQWLDQGMVWLETQIARLWHWWEQRRP